MRGLDERVERLDAGQRKVELDVAEMKGRMSQSPSMWAMLTAMLGGQVAFAAVMATIWRMAGIH